MNQKDWAIAWQKHLTGYLSGEPRTGIFIKYLTKKIKSSLELGCGSGRDSIYLSKKGVSAIATDYEPVVIGTLQEKFKDLDVKFCVADALNLAFPDKSFDLVFHNGLFVLFGDDEIFTMLKEQERVSRKYILILVHNKENQKLINSFAEKAPDDPVFNIRFFYRDDIDSLVEQSGIKYKRKTYYKFGGKADILNYKILRFLPNILYPFRKWWTPRLYQFQPWEKTERIGCLLEI